MDNWFGRITAEIEVITDQLNLNCYHHAVYTRLIFLALACTSRGITCRTWEMNILLYTQLRDLSQNIATRFVHHTKKNVERLEMVQRRSTRTIRSTDKHDLQEKFETTGLIFT